ncbi:MAG: DUF1015 domain-containing protein [Elusimicrobiota bacterium]
MIGPFPGVRFSRRASLSRTLCPPYDVIPEPLAASLRKRGFNAIHVESPGGDYAEAKRTWERWLRTGVLERDPKPAFYVVEESFAFSGRSFTRIGFFCGLGLDPRSSSHVLAHERTLSKPKKDRTKLLRVMRVNVSPILGVYADPGRAVRRVLDSARRRTPTTSGRFQGVSIRLWKIDDDVSAAKLQGLFIDKDILIADGHHRYEVAKKHWERVRKPGAAFTLACFVDEADPGLVVLPTHRVLRSSPDLSPAVATSCRSLARLERALERSASPCAFGWSDGRTHRLMVPKKPAPHGFGTEWLAKHVLASVDPKDIVYVRGVAEASAEARRSGGVALLVRPFAVRDIREAVKRFGLLPQKSTYFYPKVPTGLVFRESA